MNNKVILILAAVFGFVAVILGAMGAHALEGRLSPEQLDSFATAVRYQMWHALALLFVFATAERLKHFRLVATLWTLGIILFSGSIYLLNMQVIWNINLSWLGPVTPLGGLLLIAGWLGLFISAWKLK